MSKLTKSLLFRLRNGFVSGFLGVLITVQLSDLVVADGVSIDLASKLALSALAGGVAGALLALDKFVREN